MTQKSDIELRMKFAAHLFLGAGLHVWRDG